MGVPSVNEAQANREARWYEKRPDGRIACLLCPHACLVTDTHPGRCGVRRSVGGSLVLPYYGRISSLAVDPIEKKPLYHFHPGSRILSAGFVGCSFHCKFCQNWEISQFRPEQVRGVNFPPETVVLKAKQDEIESIAFTYTEPVIFYEYMFETAKLAKQKGVKSVMISNGYIKEKPMSELCEHLSAVKIDLKAFTEKFYAEQCKGKLQPVRDTLKLLHKKKMWYEIVVLVIPTLNDSEDEMTRMCAWIHDELGPDVPLHFSRFHPMYKIKNLPPTPVSTLTRAREIAMKKGINYVYVGNVPGHEGENTYCPGCKKAVVRRIGYNISADGIEKGKCKYCARPIAGVWKA